MFNRIVVATFASVTLAVCLMAVTLADDRTTAEDEEINALMIERRDALRERVQAVRKEHRQGRTGVDRVLAAENDALDAELDLAKTPQERIALRRKALTNFEQIERFAYQNFSVGNGSIQEALEAKANRIAAKIALLREQTRD